MSLQVQERRSRVPVEHRFLGLDKRSFPVAFFVIAVFLVLTVAIPLVDRAIDWDDPARPGDELALSDTITFAPTSGWEVTAGFRAPASGAPARSGPARVTSGGVTVSVVPDKFDGTPAALLEQVQKVTSATDDPTFRVDDDPTTLTTASGEVGVVQTYRSVRGDGLVAAFVIGETGIQVTAYGPPEAMTTLAPDIRAMITSIRATGTEGSGS